MSFWYEKAFQQGSPAAAIKAIDKNQPVDECSLSTRRIDWRKWLLIQFTIEIFG